MPNPIKPTVGRMVYFYETDGATEQAATIVKVYSDDEVNLRVFYADERAASTFLPNVPWSDDHHGYSWDWMPFQVGQAKAQAAN